MAYSPPAAYPYKDQGQPGALPLQSGEYNAMVASMISLAGAGGRVDVLEARALPVINVKADFGAAGNGATDDTAAIQAALNAVPAGGAIVLLPAGDYMVSAMLTVTRHGTVIRGVGAGTDAGSSQNTRMSRLRASGSLSGNPMLRVQAAANVDPLYGCMIEDIALDGANLATGHGLHWRSYQSHLNRVHIYRFTSGRGLWLQGYASWHLYDSIVSQVEVASCATGIYNDVGATDMHLTNCIVFDNGVNLDAVDGASQQFTACHFYGATSTDNIRITNSLDRSKFVGCKIEGAPRYNVNIDTTGGGMSDLQFVGCNFADASLGANNTYDSFIVQGPGTACTRLMICGCTFTHYGNPATKPRYAINLSNSSTQGAVVVGNIIGESHYVTAAINDNSSNSYPAAVRDNGGGGYIQRKTGTATIPSGSTSVTVTHGLVGLAGITPSVRHVSVTPTNNLGSASKFWISSVGATTFTINTNVDPGAGTATFAWVIDV